MSKDNVIRPAGFAPEAVSNPKTRGRPKGTVSLRTERRRRKAATLAESPYHPSVVLPPVREGHFHYPKELLLQKCFKNSYGWLPPRLGSSIFCYEGYTSPMEQLLRQLEAEGHDVVAPKLEWRAMRQIAEGVQELSKKLFVGINSDVLHDVVWNIEFDGYR